MSLVYPVVADDWANNLPQSSYNHFFKQFDWEKTILGTRSQWPLELRLYVLQVLTDSRPCCVYWGDDLVAIYNEPFTHLVGQKHPSIMGVAFTDAFPEIKDAIIPLFDAAKLNGQSIPVSDLMLMVQRNGFTEEAFFSGSLNPIRLLDGTVAGIHNSSMEVTRQSLSDRRRKMINTISTFNEISSADDLWAHITECLSSNQADVPVALLYQVVALAKSGSHRLSLKGALGLPAGHPFIVQNAELQTDVGVMPLLSRATIKIVTQEVKSDYWGLIDWPGPGEPPRHISAIPILNAGRLLGFLAMAHSPYRPLDFDEEQLLQDISRQLSWTISTTLAAEESLKREQLLQDQLAESEQQIRYLARHSDIGMQHLSLDGQLIWANGYYHTMMGDEDDRLKGPEERAFLRKDRVLDEDYQKVVEAWIRVTQGHKSHLTEIRLKRQYTPSSGDLVPATIILSAFPYLENGRVKSVMACMTDVSRLKWAESWQTRIAQEASESKRQQGEYIDVISHEVRNPLSAILQLADGIAHPDLTGRLSLQHIVDDNIEAATMILTCAQHQKRIVDDVLTLSKMDFELMTLTPSSMRPQKIVDSALKMLGADLAAGHIQLHVHEEDSLKDLNIDHVNCDSLRVTQILINLISNAIKFTKREARRDIKLSYGATLVDPRNRFPATIKWATAKRRLEDVTLNSQWGAGEPLYLTFSIEDTGPGMTEEDLQRLFNRFEQATPRTTIKYGGTGLGLFISHTLTEKQSGSIGVSSVVGGGSTFVFYIKVRRNPTETSNTLNRPSARIELSKTPVVSDVTAARTPSASADSSHGHILPNGANNFNVLLVEDNIINQKVLKRQLEQAGCIVLVANHGGEAIAILSKCSRWQEHEPSVSVTSRPSLDVILMDWEMPVMDGLTCTRQIRSFEQSGAMAGHIEIIATTANVRLEQLNTIRDAGADTVMPKPFKVSQLLSLIRERLNPNSNDQEMSTT